LYPNPFRETVHLSSIAYLETVSFRIYNASGVLLTERTEYLVNGNVTLDLPNLSSGIYFFEIIMEGDNEIHKAIKI